MWLHPGTDGKTINTPISSSLLFSPGKTFAFKYEKHESLRGSLQNEKSSQNLEVSQTSLVMTQP